MWSETSSQKKEEYRVDISVTSFVGPGTAAFQTHPTHTGRDSLR